MGGWFWSHDLIRYPYLSEQFKEAFGNGFIYPRWMPDLMAGYGYPTFVYYQPGFFFFSLLFTALLPTVAALKTQIFVLLMIGGGGAYLLARELIRSMPYRLVATYFYMITPYVSVNLNFRGALAEFQAMLLCPLALWLLLRFTRAFAAGEKSANWLTAFILLVTAVIYSHPFVALYLLPMLGFVSLYLWGQTQYSLRYLAVLFLAICIACALSAPYWYSVEAMRDQVDWGWSQFMMSRAKSLHEYFNSFFNPGPAHFAIAVIGFILGRKNPFIFACAMVFAVMTFMTTPWSKPIWQLDTPLRLTQFAWRLNSVHALVQFIGIASALHWLDVATRHKTLRKDIICFTLVLTALATAYTVYRPKVLLGDADLRNESARRVEYRPYSVLSYRKTLDDVRINKWENVTATNEFRPKHVRVKKIPHRNRYNLPIAEVFPNRPGKIEYLPDNNPNRIHFTFTFKEDGRVRKVKLTSKLPVKGKWVEEDEPQEHSSILLNQFFLPGWKVIINGEPAIQTYTVRKKQHVNSFGPGHGGRIRINFAEPGKHDVVAYYDGPPGWQQRNAFSLITLALCLYLIVRIYPSRLDQLPTSLLARIRRTFDRLKQRRKER